VKKEVQRLLEKADHALEVAESLYKQGFIQDASSRIYYAMFLVRVSRLRAALKAAYLAGESPAPGIAYLPG
jgi:hypothetical protein